MNIFNANFNNMINNNKQINKIFLIKNYIKIFIFQD